MNKDQKKRTLTEEERSEAVREHFSTIGKKGGLTMKKRGREYFQKIGKKGAKKRWNDRTQSDKYKYKFQK